MLINNSWVNGYSGELSTGGWSGSGTPRTRMGGIFSWGTQASLGVQAWTANDPQYISATTIQEFVHDWAQGLYETYIARTHNIRSRIDARLIPTHYDWSGMSYASALSVFNGASNALNMSGYDAFISSHDAINADSKLFSTQYRIPLQSSLYSKGAHTFYGIVAKVSGVSTTDADSLPNVAVNAQIGASFKQHRWQE